MYLVFSELTSLFKANGPVCHPDADAIFSGVLAFGSPFDHALTEIVNKKSAFANLPIDTIPLLILTDLEKSRESTGMFADALIGDAPVRSIGIYHLPHGLIDGMM